MVGDAFRKLFELTLLDVAAADADESTLAAANTLRLCSIINSNSSFNTCIFVLNAKGKSSRLPNKASRVSFVSWASAARWAALLSFDESDCCFALLPLALPRLEADDIIDVGFPAGDIDDAGTAGERAIDDDDDAEDDDPGAAADEGCLEEIGVNDPIARELGNRAADPLEDVLLLGGTGRPPEPLVRFETPRTLRLNEVPALPPPPPPTVAEDGETRSN